MGGFERQRALKFLINNVSNSIINNFYMHNLHENSKCGIEHTKKRNLLFAQIMATDQNCFKPLSLNLLVGFGSICSNGTDSAKSVRCAHLTMMKQVLLLSVECGINNLPKTSGGILPRWRFRWNLCFHSSFCAD